MKNDFLIIKKYNLDKTLNLDDILIEKIKANSTKVKVEIENWDKYKKTNGYPKVDSYLFFDSNKVCVYYKTFHNQFLARFNNNNDSVYKDTCLEFFLTFDRKKYYNFEIDANKACISGYGKDRYDRIKRNKKAFNNIKILSEIGFKDNLISWNLLLRIDIKFFEFDNLDSFDNKDFYFNIYSCFDDAKNPYYLSAFPIKTLEPDFHRPKFFQKGVFKVC